MEEVADTSAAAGLPDGFHRAAAELYGRMTRFRDAQNPPSGEQVAAPILAETALRERPATGYVCVWCAI